MANVSPDSWKNWIIWDHSFIVAFIEPQKFNNDQKGTVAPIPLINTRTPMLDINKTEKFMKCFAEVEKGFVDG